MGLGVCGGFSLAQEELHMVYTLVRLLAAPSVSGSDLRSSRSLAAQADVKESLNRRGAMPH